MCGQGKQAFIRGRGHEEAITKEDESQRDMDPRGQSQGGRDYEATKEQRRSRSPGEIRGELIEETARQVKAEKKGSPENQGSPAEGDKGRGN